MKHLNTHCNQSKTSNATTAVAARCVSRNSALLHFNLSSIPSPSTLIANAHAAICIITVMCKPVTVWMLRKTKIVGWRMVFS